MGPENSRNPNLSWNLRNFFGENSRILFLSGQKIPGFLNQLNSRSENSLTEFSRTFNPSRTVDLEVFLCILCIKTTLKHPR